jgi:hypothetical protein
MGSAGRSLVIAVSMPNSGLRYAIVNQRGNGNAIETRCIVGSAQPPNKPLQLTGHSTFQSIHDTIWHSTMRSDPPGQHAGS